jgi:hypothetical protein
MPAKPPLLFGIGLSLLAATALAQTDGGTSNDPLDAPPTCTSGAYWTKGTRPSPDMEPGRACIACHQINNGPLFTVAGTVYPTGHEPDDCYGTAAAGATVTVRDATGKEYSFVANSPAGNFFGSPPIVFPITARVTVNGLTRLMVGGAPSGDCNSCHTQAGQSAAPGRVTLPAATSTVGLPTAPTYGCFNVTGQGPGALSGVAWLAGLAGALLLRRRLGRRS